MAKLGRLAAQPLCHQTCCWENQVSSHCSARRGHPQVCAWFSWTGPHAPLPSADCNLALFHLGGGWGLFPGAARGKEPSCQCRRLKRCKFDPWDGKIPGRRARHSWRILAWRIPPVHRFTRVTWHPRTDYISMEKNWSYQFKQRALLDTVYTSRTNKIYTQSTRLRGM